MWVIIFVWNLKIKEISEVKVEHIADQYWPKKADTMATSTKEKEALETLTGDNYISWAKRTKAALQQKRWWEAIDPGYENIDFEDLTRLQIQKTSDALNYLVQRVDSDVLHDIDHCTRAKEAWEELEEAFAKLDTFHVILP